MRELLKAVLANGGGFGGGAHYRFGSLDKALRAREDPEWQAKVRRDRSVVVIDLAMQNLLFTEGSKWLLDQGFQNHTPGFQNQPLVYLGLCHDGANAAQPLIALPSKATTLASLPVTTYELDSTDCPGYSLRRGVSRAAGEGGVTLALDAGDWKMTTAEVQFVATADWRYTAGALVGQLVNLTWVFLASDPTVKGTTGSLIAMLHLKDKNSGVDIQRTMQSGDVFSTFYGAKMHGEGV